MCFYNDDYDWIAEVEELHFIRAEKACKCAECNCQIVVGDWYRRLCQKEFEMCQICEDSESFSYLSADASDYDTEDEHVAALADLVAHEHSYGETFSASTCRKCCLVLTAIYDLEAKEGCPEYARQPDTGELSQALFDDARHSKSGYAQHAVEMFPELSEHKLITQL